MKDLERKTIKVFIPNFKYYKQTYNASIMFSYCTKKDFYIKKENYFKLIAV